MGFSIYFYTLVSLEGRNEFIFNSQDSAPSQIWFLARKFAKEYHFAFTKVQKKFLLQSLLNGSLMMEVTLSLILMVLLKLPLSLPLAGGLIRDSTGSWVAGFVVNIGKTDSLSAGL